MKTRPALLRTMVLIQSLHYTDATCRIYRLYLSLLFLLVNLFLLLLLLCVFSATLQVYGILFCYVLLSPAFFFRALSVLLENCLAFVAFHSSCCRAQHPPVNFQVAVIQASWYVQCSVLVCVRLCLKYFCSLVFSLLVTFSTHPANLFHSPPN